jgi:hypothetical protein
VVISAVIKVARNVVLVSVRAAEMTEAGSPVSCLKYENQSMILYFKIAKTKTSTYFYLRNM